MGRTQVADRPFPDYEFTRRDWLIAVVRQTGSRSLNSRFIFAALLFIACVVALALAIRRANERAEEISCESNLRMIGLGLQNYHSVWNVYPSPDSDGHSWRVRCLPLVISSPMFSKYRFDEPWNSNSNLTIDSAPLESKDGTYRVFPNPYGSTCGSDNNHSVAYLMLVGEHAFGAPDSIRRAKSITDGLDSTLAVGETIRDDIHWLSPTDFDVARMSFRINDGLHSISSIHPRGPAVLFCDGHVFRVNPGISPDVLKALITIDGGEPVSRDELVRRGDLLVP